MESDLPSVYDVRAQNPGKADSEIKEIYIYGAGLESIQSIIGISRFTNLQFLSLHNNEIQRIEGLETLTSLTELNLSSNNIAVIEGLSSLSGLRILNLSCNRIKEISGLEGLFSLNKLILSHNYITKLSGITALHGPRCTLKYLDLKDNFVKSLAELWQLAGCIHLEELLFSQGKYTNPVCQENTYKSTLSTVLPQLKYLDGEPLPIPELQPLSTAKTMVKQVAFKGPHRKSKVQTQPKDEYESRLGLLEARFSELFENMKSHEENKIKSKARSKKEQDTPSRLFDYTMRGFKKKPNEDTLKDDHERLGLLESRFTEVMENIKILQNIKVLDVRDGDTTEEDSLSSGYKVRRKEEQKKHKRGRIDDELLSEHGRSPTNTSTLEQISSEIGQLHVELVKLKEELLRRNEHTDNKTSNQGSSPSLGPGKENVFLDKALKVGQIHEKEAEMHKMQESAACTQELIVKSVREQVKDELLSLQTETEKLAFKEAVEVANCLRQNAERALMDITVEKEALRQSVANMGKTLEDERAKLRICNTELESCKRKEVLAHEEVKRLSTLLARERTERKNEIERLTSSHEQKLRSALDRETKQGEKAESLRAKLQSIERQLQQATEEKMRSSEFLDKLRNESCQENAELKQALKTVVQKEQDAEALLAELTAVVHSQKLKLQAAQGEIGTCNEELQILRLEMTTLKKQAAKSDDLVESMKLQLSGSLSLSLSLIYHLLAEAAKAAERERKKLDINFNTQLEALKDENEKLHAEVATLTEKLHSTENALRVKTEKLQASDDAVRIKTKMLDSQNDTIRELKMELSRTKDALKESKSSVEFVENEWKSRFRDEVEQGRALRKELAAQDVVISELEEELKAQKAACLTAEHDYDTLKQKLKEKDEMLRYVESEINHVKSLYENREKTIASERDQAVEKLELAVAERKRAEDRTLEAERQIEKMNAMTMDIEKKEKEFSVTLKQKNEELVQSSQMILKLEKELKELERQKALSSAKVSKLSKVLDELRDAS